MSAKNLFWRKKTKEEVMNKLKSVCSTKYLKNSKYNVAKFMADSWHSSLFGMLSLEIFRWGISKFWSSTELFSTRYTVLLWGFHPFFPLFVFKLNWLVTMTQINWLWFEGYPVSLQNTNLLCHGPSLGIPKC